MTKRSTAVEEGRGARRWLAAAGPLTIAAVAGLIWLAYDAGDPRRPIVGALLSMLGVVLVAGDRIAPLRRPNVRIGLALAIVVGLAAFGANDIALVVLGFLLASDAMSRLPAPVGARWVVGLAALTAIHFVRRANEPWAGLLVGLGAGGGYAFMGSAAYATRRAETLLGELRAAHEQLRASAAQAEALAVAQERERLSREMHDTLGHRLTVAAVQLEGAARLVTADPERARGMIETVREQVTEGLGELRDTVAALRLPASQVPLKAALEHVVAAFSAATGIRTALDVTADAADPDGPAAHALLRAAQEGLTNVQRHSGAARAWVALGHDAGGWRLEVRDDGSRLTEAGRTAAGGREERSALVESLGRKRAVEGGILASAAANAVGILASNDANADTPRHGLRGLAERAAALGGSLTVDQAPEGGVRVALWLPAASSPTPETTA